MSDDVLGNMALLKKYATVRAQGRSLRVTIPADIVEERGIEEGEQLRVATGERSVAFVRD